MEDLAVEVNGWQPAPHSRGRVVFVIDGGPPQEIKAGPLLFLKRNTVYAMPEILEEPVIMMAVDTPRRAPTDIVFVNPADGTPASFISDRDQN